MTYQQFTAIGRTGRDADLRYTSQGIAVCDFSIAVSKVTGKGEDRTEKTTWIKVTCWRERAETAAQYIKKGMKLLVVGEIDASAYTNKEGKPAASLELTCTEFKFLDSKEDGGGGVTTPARGKDKNPSNSEEMPF